MTVAQNLLGALGNSSDAVDGKEFLSFRTGSGAQLIVPQRLRRAGLALYNPQAPTGILAKLLMCSGLWRSRPTSLDRNAVEDLRRVLAEATGRRGVNCAFHVAAPAPWAKTVVLVMDEGGQPLAYAKLAVTDAAKAAVTHEYGTLERLGDFPELQDRIPRALGRLCWNGALVILLSAGPAARAPAFGPAHEAFLMRLAEATGKPGRLGESTLWARMNERLTRWHPSISAAWQQRYHWAFEHCLSLCHAPIRLSLAHGDFAPWNLRSTRNGPLFVFDWEFARDGAPPGYDLFYYHLAWRAAQERALDKAAITRLLARLPPEASADMPSETLLAICLADVALHFHEAGFLTGDPSENRMVRIAGQGLDCLRMAGR